jgi:hypothetical protein
MVGAEPHQNYLKGQFLQEVDLSSLQTKLESISTEQICSLLTL